MNRIVTIALGTLTAFHLAGGAEWNQWRGPGGGGHADSKNLPTTWSETENVTWKTKIPGRGYSSPVIAGDEIWLTTALEKEASDADKKERLKKNTGGQPLIILSHVRMQGICLDRKSGKITKTVDLLELKDPQWVHAENSYASPTPILQDGRLYGHFGAHGNVCVDTKSAKVLWRNTELEVMHENGPGSSPLLYGNVLILTYDGSDEQFVAALNKDTGKLVWKTPRSGEMHENPQLKKAYGTPMMLTIDGVPTVVSNGANWLYGYDPADGKERWKVPYGQLGFSNVAKPVGREGRVYLSTGFMKAKVQAFEVTKHSAKKVWEYSKGVPKVCSPLIHDQELYIVSDKGGIVTCLDIVTGEEIWKERLGGDHNASPLQANGKLYFSDVDGVTSVVATGRDFEKIAANKLNGRILASAAVDHDALIIRTDKALYRIED